MDEITQKRLREAKEHFRSWRLLEAYNILRRYFDRLPFKPEPEHAEHIGMFARTLVELGKDFELNFYMAELEKLYQRHRDPHIAYPLGVIYMYLPEARMEQAKDIFEQLVKDPHAEIFHPRAKMMLADYYDRKFSDTPSCRRLIDSIGEVEDPYLHSLVQIWKGKILRDEKRYGEAESLLKDVLTELDPKEEWYPYFSGKVVLAILYVRTERFAEAEIHIEGIRQLFEKRFFKSIQVQVEELRQYLEKSRRPKRLNLIVRGDAAVLSVENRSLNLDSASSSDRLLMLLARRKTLTKEQIVNLLFSREYDRKRDDRLVYSQIHVVRKRLMELGLASDSIEANENGYRLNHEVIYTKEEL